MEADPLTRLMDSLIRDSASTLCRIVTTLELGKIERDHQNYSMPSVIMRRYDELGLVSEYHYNPIYRGTVPDIPEQIDALGFANLFERLMKERHRWQMIRVMLQANLTEQSILARLPPNYQEKNPPLLIREFDEFGMPFEYADNGLVLESGMDID